VSNNGTMHAYIRGGGGPIIIMKDKLKNRQNEKISELFCLTQTKNGQVVSYEDNNYSSL